MKPHPTPPKWADRFLIWFCSEELLEEIQGDLHEAFLYRYHKHGRTTANRLFIADVFRFFKPYAFEKYSRAKQFLPMYNNYFKIAIRNILHRKSFTGINLLGLTIGVSAVMLIGLYLHHELTYDRDTPAADRIYRLMNNYRAQTYSSMYFADYNDSAPEVQLRLLDYLRGQDAVEAAAHFVPSQSAIGGGGQFYVAFDNRRFVAENALFTNSGASFQEIFPQEFIMGTPEEAFYGFNKIILTESLAERWFGGNWSDQALIGKALTIEDEVFALAGVVADVPGNRHYDFDFIIHQKSIPSWGAYTYLKLNPGVDPARMIGQLNADVDKIYPGYTEDELSKGITAVALPDIHFTEGTLYELKPVARPAYLTTFALVALVILLIIWTNYTNLSVAMYADRQKEMGMRKVLGARPRDISFQLLTEAVLLALLCLPFCWMIIYTLLPHFNELMALELSTGLSYQPLTLLAMLGLLLITGLFSGLYPALAYGRRPSLRLFGKPAGKPVAGRFFNFRNVLLTGQFMMVVGLLSITWYIYQQMEYVRTKDLGYQREGIIYFNIDGAEKYTKLKTALERLPEIRSVGANGVPGSEMYNQLTYKMQDTEVTLSDGTDQYMDYGSLKTLGIRCEACQALEAGKERVFVINRTAAEKLARIKGVSPEELVGETLITEPEWENEEFGFGVPHVIDGIIDDFKYFSLKYPNQSHLLTVSAEPGWAYEMLVRAETDQWSATISKIAAAYETVESVRPFDFNFLEDRLEQLYTDERRSGILMGSLSLVAIILALMGLAGIVSYIAYGRQKEIGIRKVLGASAGSILWTFNREFTLLMAVATVIALPLSMLLAAKWLEGFAFRIVPQFWVVLLSGTGALILVMLLVSIQARKAALKQPVEVLRSE
ncbi:FtsX-like permease family protein [Flavilitoribacter nigricans]|uniref:FtsX-like permease family protein n=1 Tax=Flavilitoribacter nigricans (strain ATCC 23147 / DSM 23189 / NBRC 102662 / NCIMB 1420 / SS-2) TaxID=1122177 RepID=A0A2D0N860_FLAN2|nr:FtsX-like permease family protein [Flavilitoribacter nigricans]PHN04580.1 hypothetical protein CRP01_21485 [Flavilitoribacter nigricans DSM 23189 = NBRC 102662]